MATLCAELFYEPNETSSHSESTQRAVFMRDLLWDVGDTINIYFIEPIPTAVMTTEEAKNGTKWNTSKIPWIPGTDSTFKYMGSEYKDGLYNELQWKVDPKTLVERVVKERIEPLVNLKFAFVTDPKQSDVRIKFDCSGGCSSKVGINSRKAVKVENLLGGLTPVPTMYYAWLDVSTVIHEFCHVLGMIHEHQNPSENPIQWNEEAVYCYYLATNPSWTNEQVKVNVLNRINASEVNGSNYDRASVMIYSFPADIYCDSAGKMLNLTIDGMSVDPNYRLSNGDIQWLEYMYPASGVRDSNFDKYPKDVPSTPVFDPDNITNNLRILWGVMQENPIITIVILVVILLIISKLFF
jgi:hypothetical protein